MRKIRLTEKAVEEAGDNRLLNLPDRQIVISKEGVEVGLADADILLSGYADLVEEVAMPEETGNTVTAPPDGKISEPPPDGETTAEAAEGERLGGSSGLTEE